MRGRLELYKPPAVTLAATVVALAIAVVTLAAAIVVASAALAGEVVTELVLAVIQ